MAAIEAIATTYLEANATSVTFTSLGSYEHLQLRYTAHSTYVVTNSYDSIIMRFATGGGAIDSGTNYFINQIYAAQTSAAGNVVANTNDIYTNGMSDSNETDTASARGTAGYGPAIVDILDYLNGNKNTTALGITSTARKDTATAYIIAGGGAWDNPGAIDKIELKLYSGSDFVRGSSFTLYGLKIVN